MFHFCYKTTNVANGKFYLGKHSTDNLNDGYQGSGELLLKAIKKHGKENFETEIICFFESSQEAFDFEELLIEPWMLDSDLCYNLVLGGCGALPGPENRFFGKVGELNHNFGKKRSQESRERMRQAQMGKKQTVETRNKRKDALVGYKSILFGKTGSDHPKFGQTCSEESRKRYQEAARARPKYACPHCGGLFTSTNLSRWHGDNCKSKPV